MVTTTCLLQVEISCLLRNSKNSCLLSLTRRKDSQRRRGGREVSVPASSATKRERFRARFPVRPDTNITGRHSRVVSVHHHVTAVGTLFTLNCLERLSDVLLNCDQVCIGLPRPSAFRVREATASNTRQAVRLLPSCTHIVHFCLSNYPPGFSPTCHSPLQYGGVLAAGMGL